MNDPNGLFLDPKRVYHLYYQRMFQCYPRRTQLTKFEDNPTNVTAANQHWGHATSRDLYHWTNHGDAIAADNSNDGIFSGSAVVDVNNTSGFFPDQDDGVVAIYTLNTPKIQNQNIAYSKDGGYTFTKYANNPVIASTSANFRDPQVVWHHETQKWVMAVAYAADLVIGFYTSPNLKDWTHASNFSQKDIPGQQFECPNLVKFSVDGCDDEKHVLFISLNPGAPLGGSGTVYLVGDFNGTHFNAEGPWKLLDFGKDNYAGQWFSNLPEGQDPVAMIWASNWDYTEEVPTGQLEGFRGADGLPRVNTLQKLDGAWTVTNMPYHHLSAVKGPLLSKRSTRNGDVTVDFSKVKSDAISFDVEVSGISNTEPAGDVIFNFTSSTGSDFLDGGIHLDSREFWINRAGTHGFTTADNKKFTPSVNTTVPSFENGRFSYLGVIDRSVLELFLNGGEQSATTSFFPNSPLDVLTVSVRSLGKKASVEVKAWGLESAWHS